MINTSSFQNLGDLIAHECFNASICWRTTKDRRYLGRYEALYELLQLYESRTGETKWTKIIKEGYR